MAGFSRAGALLHSLETKQQNGKDASARGAFEKKSSVVFRIRVPESTARAEMRIRADADGTLRVFPMRACGEHHFSLMLPMESLLAPDAPGGLFFYSYRTEGVRGRFDLARRREDLSLFYGDPDDARFDFQLVVYSARPCPPAWFYGGTMYQIFPDRFFEGATAGKEEAAAKKGGVLCRSAETFASHMRDKKQNHKNNLFFGGDLDGITEKLDALSSLGVTALYLNPIFASPSNHRYNTADYQTVDDMLGGEAALRRLLAAAHERGIAVILDGVFNHTGDDSLYFHTHGRGDVPGAAESKNSPYYPWYTFVEYPKKYESWWGIRTLPRVRSDSEAYRHFLFDADGVVRRYLRMGIDGWRLDVADELSDGFLKALRAAATAEKADALILGEVWEDATTKISYGVRRQYLEGDELDSVMNYPMRRAILDYLLKGDFMAMRRAMTELYAHYPPPAADALMNLLGTHDTVRALTALSGETEESVPYGARAGYRMTEERRSAALRRLRLAVVLQMTLPGVPCIYYGDEMGMEGFGDPFCRMPYPWGEASPVLPLYRALGALRRREPVFAHGVLTLVFVDADVLCFERSDGDGTVVVFINRGAEPYALYAETAVEVLLGSLSVGASDFGIYRVPDGADYSFLLKKEKTR